MNIWKAGIMGVVIGDALGCPVQFESRETVAKHPVTGMRGYGTFNLPPSSWTDDSSLTLALLESMARGVPCITTSVGANSEMLENKGGVVTAIGDVDSMARAFENMQPADVRRYMSEWNILKVKENYTVNAVMKALVEVYGKN